jgi:hypothetical protein
MDRGLAFLLLICLLLWTVCYAIDKNVIVNKLERENQQLRMQVFELNNQLERKTNEK